MYNPQNLPLSKKKIIKKTINSGGMLPLLLLLALFPFIAFLGSSLDFHIGGRAAFIVFLVLFIPSLVIFLISLFYQYLYYKNYYYNFEKDSAEITKGVVARSTGHVRYNKIQNIYVDQDFLDRIFGLYDVHYETAGEFSGIYSHVDGLEKENADKLTDFLKAQVENKNAVNTQTSEQKERTLENSTQVAVDDEDARIFTRENIPVEKNIIWSMVLGGTLVYAFFGIIASLRLFDDLDAALVFTILGIVFFLALAGNYIYAKIWYKNFYFKFDRSGGLITEKVLSVRNTHVYFNRIQNIDVSQSIFERLLGLYEVTMETAAEGNNQNSITISGLKKENAETLKDFILEKSKKYQSF